ncbi:MAG TPA: PTS sugar transporter subunit IIB [Candidatus Eisenbacteria bacterium]|nr:PTS sugar transporter subunit IIB [Candidatus Eisenbacteria bacterium]
MPVLLARVDDRLIHGQVVHGWGAGLGATLYAIVSDALRADPDHAELYLLAVPDGARGLVVSVAECASAGVREELERERTILLFADLETPLRLAAAGVPIPALNLGGLHHAPGKEAVLAYVFLDAADRERLRALAARGVRVEARDLPGNRSHSLDDLVGAA